MHIGGDGQAVFASVTRALLRREPRLPEEADGIEFTVDGSAMSLRAEGARAVRLSCVVAPNVSDDSELRRLMSSYLGYSDRGDGILCVDPAGQLLLVTKIEFGDDIAARVAEFCDAAMHWRKEAAHRADSRAVARAPVMSFP
jgi:hypothetical protein